MNTENSKLLNQRPIAYFPLYKDMTTSTTAGVLLSQLMYWFNKKEKFYKTDSDILEETHLTKSELKTAKRKIRELPFIFITLEGVPAKTFYKIDWKMFDISLAKFAKQESAKQLNSVGEIRQTITKTTTKKEREKNFFNDNKNAIDIYISEILKKDTAIRNKQAYEKKMVEKFIKGDDATIEVFNKWRIEQNIKHMNKVFSGRFFMPAWLKDNNGEAAEYVIAEEHRDRVKIRFLEKDKYFDVMFDDVPAAASLLSKNEVKEQC